MPEPTPAPCISRLRGELDSLTISTKSITLRAVDGTAVRGFARSVGVEQLKALLGTVVVVEGWFSFRPSGEVETVEVDSIAQATSGNAVWARLPQRGPAAMRSSASSPALDLDGIFGKWPGDESDKRVEDALREL